jgi:glycosyltransferase involved in cell wall biosynthesis
VAYRKGIDHYLMNDNYIEKKLELSFKIEFNLIDVLKLLLFCKKYKIEIVHSHTSKAMGIAALAKKFGGKFLHITTKRTVFPLKSKWSKAKYSSQYTDFVVGISQFVINTLEKELAYKLTKRKKVIFSAIENEPVNTPAHILRAELKLPEDAIVIGNTSAFTKEKNYQYFFDIAEKVVLKNKKIYFIAIGEGKEKSERVKYFEKNKNSNILILNFVENIKDYYNIFDAYFSPTLSEGLGSSFIKARSFNNFIYAYKLDALVEVMEKYQKVYWIENDDELVQHMISLKKKAIEQDPEDTYIKNFYSETYFKKYFDLYKKVLGEN